MDRDIVKKYLDIEVSFYDRPLKTFMRGVVTKAGKRLCLIDKLSIDWSRLKELRNNGHNNNSTLEGKTNVGIRRRVYNYADISHIEEYRAGGDYPEMGAAFHALGSLKQGRGRNYSIYNHLIDNYRKI